MTTDFVPQRINRAIELLAQGQPLYYIGDHSGHVLTYEQGVEDAQTWADYINVGMEHGAFNMAGLDEYLRGLVDGGPTRSGHRTPAVIVEAPVAGIVRRHGALQRLAVSPDPGARRTRRAAVPGGDAGGRSRVRGVVPLSDQPHWRGRCAWASGTRGIGSESTAAPVWGVDRDEYMQRADPWPLNPDGRVAAGREDRVSGRRVRASRRS